MKHMEDNEFDPMFLHLKDQMVEITFNGEKRYGILYFAGINNRLHGKYQVTLGRTPYWPVNPKTIKPRNYRNEL